MEKINYLTELLMESFLKLIKEYKTTSNKNAYFLVILERSRKVQFPTYSLIQLLNSISNDPIEIISSEGWVKENDDLQNGKKVFEEKKIELKKAKKVFDKNKKDNYSFKKKYLLIPAIIAVLLLVFFAIIPIFKSTEENKFWDKVCIENTMASYEYYIDRYPEGKHINEALRKKSFALEKEGKIIWDEVIRTNTKRSYLNYLSNNKNSTEYKKEAKERIDHIDWNEALKKNTTEGYAFYIREHNSYDGKFYYKASSKMEELQKIDSEIKDEEEWKEATDLDSKEAYEKYLNSNPNGKYSFIATENISKIEENKVVSSNNEIELDYSEKIRMFINTEDERDFDEVYTYYSTNLKRYWSMKNPTYSKLKIQYEGAWNSTSYSKNHIDKIVKIDDNTYDLYTRFEYFRIKKGVTKTTESQLRFVFDTNGKISELYKIN